MIDLLKTPVPATILLALSYPSSLDRRERPLNWQEIVERLRGPFS